MTTTIPNMSVRQTLLSLRLTVGRRYLATRPMLDVHDLFCDISILDITDGYPGRLAEMLCSIKRARADEFLTMFNSGETSFEGRVW